MLATAKLLIAEIEGDIKPKDNNEETSAEKDSASGERIKAQAVLFAWLFFLVIGGGMMALYYYQIRYLPDIDWHSLLIYLAAATIIGGSIGGLEALLVFLPGYIWSEFLVVDLGLRGVLCFPEPGKYEIKNDKLKDYEPCVFAIFKYLGFIFVALFTIAHFWLIPEVLVKYGPINYFVTVFSLTIAASVWVSIILERKYSSLKSELNSGSNSQDTQPLRTESAEVGESVGELRIESECELNSGVFTPSPHSWGLKVRSKNKDRWYKAPGRSSRLTKYGFWFALSTILSQIALFLIYKLASKSNEATPWELQVMCIVGVLISNHIVAACFRKHRISAVMASVLAVMLLLFAVDRYTSLSEKFMALYGFGDDHKVCMVLNDEGKNLLTKIKPSGEHWDSVNDPYKLRYATILSSVGSDYFLSLDKQKLVLPKSMVTSWVRED
ncbi:MAG TPA: hypothetical protein VLR90_14110 [Blastocatellia bacterium]|nr:hypothetical protein [Blastocatellia bacterium]